MTIACNAKLGRSCKSHNIIKLLYSLLAAKQQKCKTSRLPDSTINLKIGIVVKNLPINMENKVKKTLKEKRKHCEKKSRNDAVNGIDAGVIRKTISDYYEAEKEVPTLFEIMSILEEKGLIYNPENLKEILNMLGYRHIRCRSPSRRHLVVEKSSLAVKRLDYLREVREMRSASKDVYFMHETYMEAKEVTRKRDRYLRVELPEKIQKNERLVILHAGGQNGLTNGCFTTIRSESETGDHFSEINTPRIEKWITENFSEKLPPNCVIAISSGAHHSIEKDKRPRDMFSAKTDCQNWLKRHNIEYDESLEKCFLLELISKTRIKPVYAIDEVLKNLGHTVLRIPPIHAELNPLEYVWADIRKKLAENHGGTSVEEKRKIWIKMFSEYPAAEYQKWVDVVKNTENVYYDNFDKFDDIIDDIIERYEKDLNSDSEDWETDNSDESESDSDF